MKEKALPKGWRWANLGDLGETRMGGTPKTNVSKYWDREEITWITPEDMQEGYLNFISQSRRMISLVGLEESSAKLFPHNSVILSTTASIGKVGIAQVPLATNQQLTGIVTNHLVNPIFLGYYLLHLGNDGLANLGGTTTATHINQGSLRKLTVPLPPLPVQERIVQILQKADEIRRKRREALELADMILPALFLEVFGDPATNPKGWPVKKLKEVLELCDSGVWGERTDNLQEGVFVLRSTNMPLDGRINYTNIAIIRVPEDKIKRYSLEEGDILVNRSSGSVEHIGKTAFFRKPPVLRGPFLFSNFVQRLRANRRIVTPEYLFSFLRSEFARRNLEKLHATSSGLRNLQMSEYLNQPIVLPPIADQEYFSTIANALEEARNQKLQALGDAERLFSSLLSRAFTGELTAEWEEANAEWIAEQEALYERLPRLLVLALLVEKAKQARRAATEVLVTALMKYAFLLQMEGSAARRRLYHFVPYHYGPFAKELYTDLEALQREGLVRVESDDEEDKTRIMLVDPAKAEEALAALPDDLKENAATIVETYGDLDHNALLMSVYEKYPAYARKSRLRQRIRRK